MSDHQPKPNQKGNNEMSFDMNTRPETWPNPKREYELETAERDYVASGEHVADALSWVADHGQRHGELVDIIVDYYLESPEAMTVFDDIADGARDIR